MFKQFEIRIILVTCYDSQQTDQSSVWRCRQSRPLKSWTALSLSSHSCPLLPWWGYQLMPHITLTPIKEKLLLSIDSQLCVVQYGEFGRWSLAWVKVCYPNILHTLCLAQVGGIGNDTWGLKGETWGKVNSPRKKARPTTKVSYQGIHYQECCNC